jgi:hypothetical protein
VRNLKISNARNAIQAALAIKPTEIVVLARISCIGRGSYPRGAHDTVPGPVAVDELPVPTVSDHQVRSQLLAAI